MYLFVIVLTHKIYQYTISLLSKELTQCKSIVIFSKANFKFKNKIEYFELLCGTFFKLFFTYISTW